MEGGALSLRMMADSCSTTEVRSISHTHLWTIKGFSQCECRYLETTAKIKDISATPQPNLPSSSGGLPDLPVITFRIRLHPQGNKESNKDFSFFQCFSNQNSNSNSSTPTYKAKFKFTVFNSKGEETPTTVYSGTQQLHGYFEYIRRDVLISHIQPSDELSLSLSITVSFDTITKVTHNMKAATIQPPKPVEVTKDLEELYKSGKHTDFTITTIDGQELKTHKVILAARSPVFAAMLEPHTEESQTNKVLIKDIDFDIMQELINYMYTGKCSCNDQNSLDLLAAADRFQMSGLKDHAVSALRGSISADSVCRHLVVADMFNATELRKEAIRFIVFNGTAVTATEGFQVMSKNHPELMKEVFQCLVDEKSVGLPSLSTKSSDSTVTGSDPPAKRARYMDF